LKLSATGHSRGIAFIHGMVVETPETLAGRDESADWDLDRLREEVKKLHEAHRW